MSVVSNEITRNPNPKNLSRMGLIPSMLQANFPNEPENISGKERDMLWSIHFKAEKNLVEKAKKFASFQVDGVLGAGVFGTAAGVAVTQLLLHFLSAPTWFCVVGAIFILVCIPTLVILWWSKKSYQLELVTEALARINRTGWVLKFQSAAACAKCKNIKLCPEIEAMDLLLSNTQDEDVDLKTFKVGAVDNVAMMRFVKRMNDTVEDMGVGSALELSGDNSELLSRVAAAFEDSYKETYERMIGKLKNPYTTVL